MYFELSDENKLIKNMCHDFANEVIIPKIDAAYETKEFPLEIFKQMADLGLMGLKMPVEYGGSGADTMAYVTAMEEIARGDCGVGLTWGAHMTLGSVGFELFGTEAQKQKYLTRLAAGEILGAFGLTEPNAGSDNQGMECKAVLDGDQWVVNGTKCFISNTGTPISYGGMFLFVTGVKSNGAKEFSAFVVEKGTPGYSIGPIYKKMGWEWGDTREQIFEDCRIPYDNLIGERGAGFRQFMTILDVARIGYASTCLGVAQRCYEEALRYANERKQFGQTIGKFQANSFKLANMATNIAAARLLIQKAAWLRDNKKPHSLEAAMAKYYTSEIAMDVLDEAVQIHGGYGFIDDYPVCRYYKYGKILEIGEGTNEINQIVIARNIGVL